MKLRKVLFLVFLMLVFLVTPIAASTQKTFSEPINIRVLLSNKSSVASIKIISGEYELQGVPENIKINPNNTIQIKNEGSGNLNIIFNGNTYEINSLEPLYIKPIKEESKNIFEFNSTKYRGGVKIYPKGSNLQIVNVLNMEHYLYGVVGKEMGTSADLEALKAQAVASRSYALYKYNSSKEYDVTKDQMSQVYDGYSAELLPGGEKVNLAVDQTRGEVMYYNGKLVEGLYSSNAGGYTANSEEVWGNYVPYLRAVPSPYDSYALTLSRSPQEWPANTYHWKTTILRSELQNRLRNNNKDIGELLEIKYKKNEVNDRVIQIDFIGTKGSASYSRDNNIRSILGTKSVRFNLTTDGTIDILASNNKKYTGNYSNSLKAITRGNQIKAINPESANFYVQSANSLDKFSKYFTKVNIDGYGYGHGLGMSQWGARGMAKEGYKYQEILEHYYNQGKNDGALKIAVYYK